MTYYRDTAFHCCHKGSETLTYYRDTVTPFCYKDFSDTDLLQLYSYPVVLHQV